MPIPNDSLALGATVEQESQELVADSLSPRAKLQVAVHLMQPGLLLDPQHVGRVHFVVRRFPRARPCSNRAAVSRDQLDVDHRQAGGGECSIADSTV